MLEGNKMIVGTCKIYLRAEGVRSLKEKRMIVRSILDKCKNRFNISIAEIEEQEKYQRIVIAFACVSNQSSHANSTIDHVLNFISENTEAFIEDTVIEILSLA